MIINNNSTWAHRHCNITYYILQVYLTAFGKPSQQKWQGPQAAMQTRIISWRKIVQNIRASASMVHLKRAVRVAFNDKYLIYTNVTISVALSSVGDVMEQGYEIYTKDLDKYHPIRTAHMAASGASVGVLCHHWYKVLDRFIIGKTFDMVVKKLLLDQLIFSPIMIITFFGSLALFEKDPLQNFEDEVREKFVQLYRAEWMVWPPAQIINFYFLPTRFRVLYDNTISLGYDVYTSQVKHSKSATQKLSTVAAESA